MALPAFAQGAGSGGGEENRAQAGETVQTRSGGGPRVREQGPDASLKSDTDKMNRHYLGSFIVNPAISVSEYYDDNVFYSRETPNEDFITVASPTVSLQSDWDKHQLNMQAGADIARYRKYGNEDYEDYFAGFNGFYDLAPKSRLFGGMQFNHLHESRESPDDVLGIKPTEYDMTDIFAGGQREFADFGIKVGATMQDYNFEDVASTTGIINNDDRDRREYELGARIVKPWQKGVRLFLQTVIGKCVYDSAVDDNGFDRDSRGLGVSVGAQLHPRDNLSIELLAGGLRQDYQDPALSDVSSPDFGALVAWRPSSYTNVDFSVDRRVRETTMANASSYVSTMADIGLHHDLTQQLSLNTGASFTENDYKGVDRTDDLISFYTNSRYYFTPQLYGGLGYQFMHRDSDLAGQDYFDNHFMVRIGAQLDHNRPPAGLPSGLGRNGSFYAGVEEGHGSVFTALDGPRGAGGTVTADFGDHGSTSGFFAGYDHFLGRWFMGAEANVETSVDFDWEHIQSGDRAFYVTRGNSYGLSLRGGYRQQNNVAYFGHIGALSTGFNTDYNTGGQHYHRDETQFGFRFGGGIEAPVIGSSGFVRMDYSYATYEDYGMNLASGTDFFDNSENVMRLGYVQRFGMPQKAAQQVPHDFDGLYIGGQLGYGGFAARNSGPRNAGSSLIVDRASHGGTGGVFAGYGFTPLDHIYLGLEGEAESSYADWNIDRDPTGRVYDARKDWTLGGSLRAGYVFDDTVLLYGRFGAVNSQVHTDYTRGAQDIKQKDNLSGWRYGGGMDVAASENTFIRMDYTYTAYEDYRVNYVTGIDSFKPTETLVRVGVGYRF